MIKVSIKKEGQVTNQAQFESQEQAETWFNQERSNRSFGKIDGWYPESSLNADELATELERITPEEGTSGEVQVRIPDQFEVEYEDISAQVEQEQINREALAYLKSTDWIVIRSMDSGVAVPEEIQLARQAARERIIR